MKQKYFRGDKVRIADKMPDCMSHFPSGIEAIIEYSYSDVYGNGFECKAEPIYAVSMFSDGYFTAWYNESLLTLISNDRNAGERQLQEWKKPKEDLDGIEAQAQAKKMREKEEI